MFVSGGAYIDDYRGRSAQITCKGSTPLLKNVFRTLEGLPKVYGCAYYEIFY